MTPTEEMVRAAARAFAPELWADHDNMTPTERAVWEAGLTAKKFIAEEKAKVALSAALAAMWQDHVIAPRKPTESMIQAGDEANPTQWNEGTDYGFVSDVSADVYQAMIAAAPTLLSTRMGSEKTAESGNPAPTREHD